MSRRRFTRLAAAATLAITTLAPIAAADVVKLPDASQRASVAQTIGLTDVTVSYHRPLVNGRTIWGKLVPYGRPWRCGANENTTVTFSTAVTLEGKPLSAGTYGLHMIPGRESWVVAFSRNAASWGSFSYDESEDALRVTVTPREAPFREALAYGFEGVTPDSAVLELGWERLAVPLRIGADTRSIVMKSLEAQFRTAPFFNCNGSCWEGYQTAADWLVEHGGDLEQALQWADESIGHDVRFENWRTKSKILRKLGKIPEADDAMAAAMRALEYATPLQRHFTARQLLAEKQVDEAITVFKSNAQKYPHLWYAKSGLARAYVARGDYASAAKAMREALADAPESQKESVKRLVERLERKEDINS